MFEKLINQIQRRRAIHRHQVELRAAAQRIFPRLTVSAGPLAGMRYPSLASHGSAVLPKLLGTYEAELHETLEHAVAANPELIIDVGCAEGYYAVGLALRMPNVRVIAADCSSRARELCANMASINDVSDRVQIMGEVTKDFLRQQSIMPGGLLISDCEGGEKFLLDHEIFSCLSTWWILVELHEFIEPGIEDFLIPMASRTHDIQVIDSIDDYRRQHIWRQDRLADLPREMRLEFYREGRPGLMRWLVAKPKLQTTG